MGSQSKPLVLYGGVMGPNPAKVSMILEELSIPFDARYIPYSDVKKPEYEKINPNGRLPALEDPNKDLILWESGAIIEYLIAEYDKDNRLSFPTGSKEDYLTKQWLHFQMSGQGPYYGQAYWFTFSHPEKLPSAVERYTNEIHRVSKVLNSHLEGRQYLVGDKCTYADLAFVSWQVSSLRVIKYDVAKEFPHLQAWMDRLLDRESVKKVLAEKAEREAAIKK